MLNGKDPLADFRRPK